MRKTFLTLATCALGLVSSVVASHAQQSPAGPMVQDRPGMMMGGPSGQQPQPSERMRGMMGDRVGGTGPGSMGPGMMVMIMAMMDTDGDGTLSLPEVQAVHARIFNYADADKDGKLTLDELQMFFHRGAFGPTPSAHTR